MNQQYWQKRWEKGETGWDINNISTPLAEYLDQYTNKNIKLLIPGGGASFEANYAYESGYKNTFVVDFSSSAKEIFMKRFPSFPSEQYLIEDFFELKGTYDLILEQTFICALHPSKRKLYVQKMNELLKESGKLVGLLFDFPLSENGPPFGGNIEEYRSLLKPHFKIRTLEKCYNSIPPRMGNELFFICEK